MSQVLLLGLLLGGAAPGYSPPRYGGRATAALPSRPVTLDPVRSRRLGEWQVTTLLFDGLMLLQGQGKRPVPHLALAMSPLGRSGRKLLIRLRQGVRTGRGRLITPADVVASLRRLRRSEAGWVLASVRALKTLGGSRLLVRLHRPAPELGAVLAAPTALITPGGKAPGAGYDGTGPFRYLRGSVGSRLELGANATHFAGRPFLDDLSLISHRRALDEVRAFYLRRSQVSYRGKKLWGRSPGFGSRSLRCVAVTTVALLVGKGGPLADHRVRRAVYLAIDKRRLRTLVTAAPTQPAHGPVPPVFLGRRALRRARRLAAPHSPSRARRLLVAAETTPAVARRRLPGGVLPLSLLVDRSRVGDLDVARKIAADLAVVSIRVSIVSLSAAAFARRRLSGRFDLALDRFTSPVLRARYHLAAAMAAAGETARARRIVRRRSRRVSAAVRRFMRELPLIPLYHVGLRVEVASSLPHLGRGAWGLLRWADARYASRPAPGWRGLLRPARLLSSLPQGLLVRGG